MCKYSNNEETYMKHWRYILLTSLTMLLWGGRGFAQQRIYGSVADHVDGEYLPSVSVSLLRRDSVKIQSTVTNERGRYSFDSPGKGSYILQFTSLGYKGACKDLVVSVPKRITEVDAGLMRLKRDATLLGEVKVTATKIKMFQRGDTVVYNADAFNLADGSMLDALVARLPGCKLTKDGRIYVNGKYVESLLVNGQDFFSGNPKLALENLPAYTVKRIKVFDRMGADSKLMGRDMHDKQYVMDVRLKKEYSVGYMGNLEAGGGTDHRYMLRDFGMKFSEASRLLAFANVNNLSNDEVADVTTGGGWSSLDTPQGLLVTQAVGLSYLHMFGNETSYIGTNNLIKRTDADNQSATHTQTSTAATALATPPTRSATRRQGSTRKRCSNCSSGNGPQRTFSRCNTTTTRDGPHRRARRSWEANGSTPC